MAGQSTARRYAEAAFQIAERDGTVEKWLAELHDAGEALASGDAMRVLADPTIPAARRSQVAEQILGDRVSRGSLNLIRLLLQRGRIERLTAVAREFQRLYDRREGITAATVTSAVALGDTEVAALRERLAATTGGRIEMTMTVDPTILGGVVVRLGDRLIDGSVRGRLERLRTRLATGAL